MEQPKRRKLNNKPAVEKEDNNFFFVTTFIGLSFPRTQTFLVEA